MEKCEKCGTMNKYHDKSGQVYHYICSKCGYKWSKIFVKDVGKQEATQTKTQEKEDTEDFDAWIVNNIKRSVEIAFKSEQDSPQVISEIMRERHSLYMNKKIEMQKLQHMYMIKKERQV
jgi:hypothetical protein